MQVDDAGHAGLLEAGTEIAGAVRNFLVAHGLESPQPGTSAEPIPS